MLCDIEYVAHLAQRLLKKIKIKIIFSCKINERTGVLDPENLGKDTKIDFLSQILKKLWGIEYLAHLDQTASLFFLIGQKSFPRVLEWHFSDSRSYGMSITGKCKQSVSFW